MNQKTRGWFPIFLAFSEITSKRRLAKVALRVSELTFLHCFQAPQCSSWSKWLHECMHAWLCRPSSSWTNGARSSANTILAGDGNGLWTSCYHRQIPPPLIPIHNKAEPSRAFVETQAKLSNKGVFIPVLRSVKWISVLLYFKRSHFHQELIQFLLLSRRKGRGKWDARELSQHGSSF